MAKNQRLDATITIGSVLQKSVGKNINVIRKGLDSVGGEIKGVIERQKELSKQRKVLERQGKSVEDLDREYEELGRTLDTLRDKQARYARAQKASVQVGSSFKNMTSEVGKVARNSAIGVAAAGAAVFKLAGDTAELGDNIAKTADKLGFGIEAFQELRYAAERSGVSVETFDSSMTAMQKRIGEAANGTGAAKSALEELGLSAQKLSKMKPEDALAAIADEMAKIEDPAKQAALNAALFSRAGVGMINMLRDGSDGLNELREDARRTGNVLTDKAARGAEAFQDSLLDAQKTAQGFRTTVGAALMPAVKQAMDGFTGFMQSNRDEVVAFSEAAADKLGRTIPILFQVAEGAGRISSKVAGVVTKTAEMVGGWENFGVIVGSVMASKAILSIGSFAGSVFTLGKAMWALAPALPVVAGGVRAIGAALIANPIGLTVTAIAGGAALIIANWDKIKPYFDNLLGWLGEKFEWVMEKLRPLLNGLQWIKEKGAGAINAVGDFFGGDPRDEYTENRGARTTRRAIGGAFGKGPLLVGERGPELRYENQGGYIAHNRALERLRDMSQQAVAPRGAASGGQQVTNNYFTVQPIGTSAREVISELKREAKRVSSAALFDRPTAYGQYG
jgi:phage-related tail protein